MISSLGSSNFEGKIFEFFFENFVFALISSSAWWQRSLTYSFWIVGEWIVKILLGVRSLSSQQTIQNGKEFGLKTAAYEMYSVKWNTC